MASKDYIFKMLAASSHSKDAREEHDFYSTEPKAVEDLLRYVDLQHKVTSLVVVMVILLMYYFLMVMR